MTHLFHRESSRVPVVEGSETIGIWIGWPPWTCHTVADRILFRFWDSDQIGLTRTPLRYIAQTIPACFKSECSVY